MLRIRTQPSLHRDFALLSLFIITTFLIVSAWVAYETYEEHSQKMITQIRGDAHRVDRALGVTIESNAYLLESLGRQIIAGDPENLEMIVRLFRSFDRRGKVGYNIFLWVDEAQGIRVTSNLGILKKPIDVSDRDYVKKAIAEPWKVHVGRPIEGRVSQKWVLPLSLGITRENGEFMGVLSLSLDIRELSYAARNAVNQSGTEFAVTTTALSLVMEPEKQPGFFLRMFTLDDLLRRDFKKNTSAMLSQPSLWNPGEIFRYFQVSDRYPFVVFIAYNPASQNSVYSMILPRLIQLAVIAVFLLFVLYIVRQRIIRPVIHLTGNTARIMQGDAFEADLAAGPLEIYQLAQEIRRMYDYIEERKRVESELRLKNAELLRIKSAAQITNQVKAEFFSHVSQDLTEPLQMILAGIETLKDQHFGPLNNPRYEQHARDIFLQAQQMLAMLQEMKAISEAETGLLALNDTEIDLIPTLQKSVRIFKERNLSGIEVALDISRPLPRLRADDLRVKQLILTVLEYIAPQLDPGEVLRLHPQVKAGEVQLVFAYNAAGAERRAERRLPESLAMLPPLARAPAGLGIALAKLLIALHQGSLEIKTLPDRTTTITVRFPKARVM
jgi:signal transduction histidine kinase